MDASAGEEPVIVYDSLARHPPAGVDQWKNPLLDVQTDDEELPLERLKLQESAFDCSNPVGVWRAVPEAGDVAQRGEIHRRGSVIDTPPWTPNAPIRLADADLCC
jgi:hypothetical protein